MKIAAVIAEYNPFHNGHLYQLKEIRRRTDADLIVVMMSGDFVQRGGPACMDKYIRCRMALSAGADIVFELPVYSAMGSAEIFASSAVSLLNHLGCIDYLCFGAETDRPGYLEQIAHILADEPQLYRDALKKALQEGMNFPTARSIALSFCLQDNDLKTILNQPNNILAIEYMKALYRTDSSICPVLIRRTGAGYHSTDISGPFSSATAIRSRLEKLPIRQNPLEEDILPEDLAIPDQTYFLIKDYIAAKGILTRNDFSQMLAFRLLEPNLDLMRFADITEDIANRIDSCRHQFQTTDQFIELLTTRNFTASRISRCLFHILLGHEKNLLEEWKKNNYGGSLRVLGFRISAGDFWKEIPGSFRNQLVMRTAKDARQLTGSGPAIFQADLYASRLYRQTLRCKYQISLPAIESEPVIIFGRN